MRSGQLWTFPCYQWIGEPGIRGVGGTEGHVAAAAEKELQVGLLPASAGEEYEVAVYTGAERGAAAGEKRHGRHRRVSAQALPVLVFF
jgi:hypothetical protein